MFNWLLMFVSQPELHLGEMGGKQANSCVNGMLDFDFDKIKSGRVFILCITFTEFVGRFTKPLLP